MLQGWGGTSPSRMRCPSPWPTPRRPRGPCQEAGAPVALPLCQYGGEVCECVCLGGLVALLCRQLVAWTGIWRLLHRELPRNYPIMLPLEMCMAYCRCRGCSCSPHDGSTHADCEPNTVVPPRDIRIDSSLFSPTPGFRNIITE
ncbi:MAG: hypothetical protein Ct9H90mP24_1910 [Methanobacteriota archaeon]|nr:MAG: hypothetical protein Ct9H90mP24_1910 [Euryarchaeota archaeon]